MTSTKRTKSLLTGTILRTAIPLPAVVIGGLLALICAAPRAVAAQPPAAAVGSPRGLENEQELRKKHQEEFLKQHSDASGKVRPDLWRKGVQQQKQMQVAPYIGAKPAVSASPTP